MSEEVKQSLGPNQESWIKALESGEYKQGRTRLCYKERDGSLSFCCLGVACELAGVEREETGTRITYSGDLGSAPMKVMEWLGLYGYLGSLRDGKSYVIGSKTVACLTEANDLGASFADIAKFCRENPEKVFEDAR